MRWFSRGVKVIVTAILVFGFFLPVVHAVSFDPVNNTIGNPNNPPVQLHGSSLRALTFLYEGNDPITIAINIVNVALSFLGFISLFMMLLGGLKWFTAQDNEEDVTKAKQILSGAVMGLAITLSAMGIAQFFFNGFVNQWTVRTTLINPVHAFFPMAQAAEALPFDPHEAAKSNGVPIYNRIVGSMVGNLDNFGKADPVTAIITWVNGLLTLLAFTFMIFMIYAGVLWVTARGQEEPITKAKSIIKRSIIGLIIILASYSISTFLFILFSTGGVLRQ